MSDVTRFVESDHPRTRAGEFAAKAQTTPELTLPAAPRVGECDQPVTVFTLTTDAGVEFESVMRGATLHLDGQDWVKTGAHRWRTADGSRAHEDELWERARHAEPTLTLPDGYVYSDTACYERVPQSTGDGENLLGDRITGAEYNPAVIEAVRIAHAYTPVTPEPLVHRGETRHIGEGVWMRRCRECGAHVKSYGVIAVIPEMAEHEAGHGLQVPGWNQPLLSR
jgi:hypothetical protein